MGCVAHTLSSNSLYTRLLWLHRWYCTLVLKQRSVTRGLCALLSSYDCTLPLRDGHRFLESRFYLLPWIWIGIDVSISLCLCQSQDNAFVQITKAFGNSLISNNAITELKSHKAPLLHSKTHNSSTKIQRLHLQTKYLPILPIQLTAHHIQSINKSKMCHRLARACPECFTPHSIILLKSCEEYKHTNNCPSRQLQQIIVVPHIELCDRCWGQEQAVLEVEGRVAKAMRRNLRRGNGYVGWEVRMAPVGEVQ